VLGNCPASLHSAVMKQKEFDKIIETLASGKAVTFWTHSRGVRCTKKHIPLFRNDKQDAPGFWIGKTYYLIGGIKITVDK